MNMRSSYVVELAGQRPRECLQHPGAVDDQTMRSVVAVADAITLPVRFWTNVEKQSYPPYHRPELGPCWWWTGPLDDAGYGVRITFNGERDYPHRVSYRGLVGPIPDELELDHRCRVRHCVKSIEDATGPAHLEPVTHLENCQRRPRREMCKQGHPLEGENLYVNPTTGNSYCRICNAERQREFHAKRLEAGAKPPADARCKQGHPYDVDAQGRWFCRTCRNKRQREYKQRQKRGL